MTVVCSIATLFISAVFSSISCNIACVSCFFLLILLILLSLYSFNAFICYSNRTVLLFYSVNCLFISLIVAYDCLISLVKVDELAFVSRDFKSFKSISRKVFCKLSRRPLSNELRDISLSIFFNGIKSSGVKPFFSYLCLIA
jgi:hypothetical protein